MKLLFVCIFLFSSILHAGTELAKPVSREPEMKSIKPCSSYIDFSRASVGSACVDGQTLKFKTTKEVRKHSFKPVVNTLGIPNDSCAMSLELGGCVYWLCDNATFKTCDVK
jgi:hypothetical protein